MIFGKRHFLLLCLFWLATAFTLVMALLPHPLELPGHPQDKLQHIAAFASLTLLAVISYPRARYSMIFAALAGFGALIELFQMIPALHRDAQLNDWVADCAAILAVLSLSLVVKGLLRSRPARKAE